MLRLMTVKISSLSHKTEVEGKEHHWKDLYIVYNEEFNRLFELGLFEQPKKKKQNNPSSGGGGSSFNCSEIKYGLSDIGRFSLFETLTKEVDKVDQSKCFEHGSNKHE